MKFYGYFRSSSSYRCRIAFNLKGVDYDFESVHLKQGAQKGPEFTAINPQRLLPALITDDGAELTQSLAILEWLDETHPEPALLPTDPVERARVRAFAQVIACEIHPLQNLRVLKYLADTFGADAAATTAWLTRWLTEGLEACEALLARRDRDSAFCYGDTPGLADVCLVPQIFSAQRFGVEISHLTRIAAIHARCEALPAFADAHPARQPDYEP
ncbi:MAG: maleylacetoacetate isomerase [Rhodobacterales bacterium]|nr:maleylacetoacetate isomerase [Rhodobacterales bacterium]MDX5412944.1 maleylacetoacetate isomerase [Rhodobacterales bacterium]